MGKRANERRRRIFEDVARRDAVKRSQEHIEELKMRNFEKARSAATKRPDRVRKPTGLCCVEGFTEEQMPSMFRQCPDCPKLKETDDEGFPLTIGHPTC